MQQWGFQKLPGQRLACHLQRSHHKVTFNGQQSALPSGLLAAGVVACVLCGVCEIIKADSSTMSGCLACLKQTSKANKLSWSCTSHTDDAAIHTCNIHWWCHYQVWLGIKHDHEATDSQIWFCAALICVSMHKVNVMTEQDVSQKQLPPHQCVPLAAA